MTLEAPQGYRGYKGVTGRNREHCLQLCGQCAAGRRNEHLLFECTAHSVVALRKEVEATVEKKVSRLVKPGPVREAIMVPWRLDKAGRPPNVGVMAEVEAALGTVLGA